MYTLFHSRIALVTSSLHDGKDVVDVAGQSGLELARFASPCSVVPMGVINNVDFASVECSAVLRYLKIICYAHALHGVIS